MQIFNLTVARMDIFWFTYSKELAFKSLVAKIAPRGGFYTSNGPMLVLLANRISGLWVSTMLTQGKSHHASLLILGIITVNPPEVWPVCALPTRGSKLITLLT